MHTVRVGRESFTVDVRYRQLKLIGRGAYGSVVGAVDAVTGEHVAIKRIHDVFGDERRIKAKRILREIKLLCHLRGHENVLQIRDMFAPAAPQSEAPRNFDEVYIVCNLMETDLEQIVNSPQHLSGQHHRYFLYQILRGLKYVHSADIIHRDLKPSNLLLNANCDLALCDFGLSRGLSGAEEEGLTEYVVTRWYRAPELLCEASAYGKAVDIWSVGCIFAEILARKPFFQGKNPQHQLTLIVETVGCPPASELGFASHPAAREVIDCAREKSVPSGLRSRLPADVDAEAFDLLSKMLVVRPEDRITAEEALEHAYLQELHAQMEEPSSPFAFESYEPNGEDEIRRMMVEEMTRLQKVVGDVSDVTENSVDMEHSAGASS